MERWLKEPIFVCAGHKSGIEKERQILEVLFQGEVLCDGSVDDDGKFPISICAVLKMSSLHSLWQLGWRIRGVYSPSENPMVRNDPDFFAHLPSFMIVTEFNFAI